MTAVVIGGTAGLLLAAAGAALAMPRGTSAVRAAPARPTSATAPRPADAKLTTRRSSRPALPAVVAVPRGTTLLATITFPTPDFAAPPARGPAKRIGTVPARWHESSVTLPVIAQRPGWLDVRLPQRPNGSTGWIRSTAPRLSYTGYAIKVDVATMRVRLYLRGKPVMSAPAGVGATWDPTPTGSFFVAYLAQPPNSGYGPFVIVTSAHSNAITDWESSGDAEIGIHGPLGMDAAIGTTGARISHGCVRLHVSDLERLRAVPVGAPVTIVS